MYVWMFIKILVNFSFAFCDSGRVCDVDDDAVCLMHNAWSGMHGP